MRRDRRHGDPQRGEQHGPDRRQEKDDDGRGRRGADERLPLRKLPPVDDQRGGPNAEQPGPARAQEGDDGQGGRVDGHGGRGDPRDDEGVVDAEVGGVFPEAARRLKVFFFLLRVFLRFRERERKRERKERVWCVSCSSKGEGREFLHVRVASQGKQFAEPKKGMK